MGEMSLDNLSSQYFDVLKELGNIGAGNATTALAQMIGTKVDMSVPQVRLLDFKDRLISAFENDMICSLSGYNDMLAACEYKTDVEALPDFFVYIDEANAYFRFYPQGFVVEKSVIRLVDGRFVVDVESVYNDFSTVEVHIVEENAKPVGFDIVRTENPSIVEFSYRKDSNSSMKMRFEV